MTESFDGDWLALREGFDAASRSRTLARALADVLPARPVLLDMGAGTGSLFRWLAPILAREQRWILADADPVLLDRALRDSARWALSQGWQVSQQGGVLAIHAPGGTWRLQPRIADLASGAPDLAGVDAVLCSALLDLVSAAWIARFVAALRVPLLACLSVDGRDAWLPPHPLDAVVRGAFRRDQGRHKGFGRALGPAAPAALQTALAAHGFDVRSAPSDWRIRPAAGRMLLEMTRGFAGVALRQRPDRGGAVQAWRRQREQQVARHRLAIRIGHRDTLAIPGTTRG